MLIQDKSTGRVVHFGSDPEFNILNYFNKPQQREFFSCKDFRRFGGRVSDDFLSETIRSGDRHTTGRSKQTSIIGSLHDQRVPLQPGYVQQVTFAHDSDPEIEDEHDEVENEQINDSLGSLDQIVQRSFTPVKR